jgi:group I intron endonuclease
MNLIYKATNLSNGKSYIGITTKSLPERIRGHKYNAIRGGSPFSKAIRKYGIDGFQWDVIRTCSEIDETKNLECFYISEFGTHASLGNGYNSTLGGDGVSGYVFTDEVKRKISEAGIGRVKSEETRKKLSIANKGKPYKGPKTRPPRSEEVKRKMYENNPGFTGKKWDDSHREKITTKLRNIRESTGYKNQKFKSCDIKDVLNYRSNGESFKSIGMRYGCTAPTVFYFVKRMSE